MTNLLHNASSFQKFCGWYTDESLGGIDGAIKSMLKADPQFIMGNCFRLCLDFMAGERSIKTDSTFKDDLRALEEMAAKNPNATKRELKHVDALIKYSHGDYNKAFLVWESILLGEHKNQLVSLNNLSKVRSKPSIFS